jgi:hypothetical protein
MSIYRAFSSTVEAKYSIASTGTDSTQKLNAVPLLVATASLGFAPAIQP